MQKKTDNCRHCKIVIDLINNDVSITDALFCLKLLVDDLNDNTITEWIESELEGYKNNDSVPSYRTKTTPIYGLVQIIGAGNLINREMNIPIKKEYLHILDIAICDNIAAIEKWASKDNRDKKMPVDLRVANSAADMNISEMCQIMNAWHPLPQACFLEITNAVKNRVINILLKLEKKYGNLDNYLIDYGNKVEKDNISKEITTIIFNDNSTKIGDNNSITKSVIGDKNEY